MGAIHPWLLKGRDAAKYTTVSRKVPLPPAMFSVQNFNGACILLVIFSRRIGPFITTEYLFSFLITLLTLKSAQSEIKRTPAVFGLVLAWYVFSNRVLLIYIGVCS